MALDRSEAADAKRFRWLLSGNGYFLEESFLCGRGNNAKEAQDRAREAIDLEISHEQLLLTQQGLKP